MPEGQSRDLSELLSSIAPLATAGIQGLKVTGIAADSRKVGPGNLFVAVAGQAADGHAFIGEALARGAAAVVAEQGRWQPGTAAGAGIIEVADSRAALGHLAAAFYGHPGRRMRLIAITGTNGKTTTSYLLEAVIAAAGGRPGVLGTVSYRYRDRDDVLHEQPAALTTPEPLTLHRLLREMAVAGVTHAVMEVSSHALALQRIAGLMFDVAVFTNLSRDHLDFHPDMEHYFASKKLLFCNYLKPEGRAVILVEQQGTANASPDSSHPPCWGVRLANDLCGPAGLRFNGMAAVSAGAGLTHLPAVICGGLHPGLDIFPREYRFDLNGITARVTTPLGVFSLSSALVGEFNLKNLLAALGAGLCLGLDQQRVLAGLQGLAAIPGRLERVESKKGILVFVDYAHTPDALENVLATLRRMQPARLVCVFGCGGDRDPGKRPLMGRVAGSLADVVLATSDNPRSEAPEAIMAAIEPGLIAAGLTRRPAAELLGRPANRGYDIIVSRQKAIRAAVQNAQSGDVILIAGKGHENYQITRSGKIFFDDRSEAKKYAEGGCPC